MGLDMYLTGKKYLYRSSNQIEDGFPIEEKLLKLGYWRKHPNLHGFIVTTFAGGDDNCEEIDLTKENIQQIITAVETDSLPHTTGFFFGSSDGTEKDSDLQILTAALKWLESEEESISRSVVYCASW